MYTSGNCDSKGCLLLKQKRPALVANFLNKFPLKDRHFVVNALLTLGFRAYERAAAAAPADIDTLRTVVAMEMAEKKVQSVMMSGNEVSSDWNKAPTKLSDMHSPHQPLPGLQQHLESLGKEEMTHSVSQDGTTPISQLTVTEEPHFPLRPVDGKRETRNIYSVKIDPGCESPNARLPLEQLVAPALSKLDENDEGRDNIACMQPQPPLNCSKSRCISSTAESKRYQAPALKFILTSILGNAVGRYMFMHRSRMDCSFSSGTATTPLGDERWVNQEISDYDVSEGTSVIRGRAVSETPLGDIVRNTALSLSVDENYYPMEFLHCVMKHIESTRGARENPVVVAASIPQHLATYTLHNTFRNLYRSLLLSYHLSTATGKYFPMGLTN